MYKYKLDACIENAGMLDNGTSIEVTFRKSLKLSGQELADYRELDQLLRKKPENVSQLEVWDLMSDLEINFVDDVLLVWDWSKLDETLAKVKKVLRY